MINPNELVNQSQLMVEQRRQQSELRQLAKIAAGRSEQVRTRTQQQGYFSQLVRGLLVRLRIARLEV